MEEQPKIPFIVRLGAIVLSLFTFSVGFWHAHLGLKNQHFFGSEYGSLVIAAIILLLLLICYYFAIVGKKIALLFYLICAFSFIVFNLNYFYPYDFKEDLVKEDAGALKDTLQSYATRAKSINVMKSEAMQDYLDLEQLKKQINSEIALQHGCEEKARSEIKTFNDIVKKYGVKEVAPSLVGVTDYIKQAEIVDADLEGAMTNFIERTLKSGDNIKNARTKIDAEEKLISLTKMYTPILEDIQSDTTKINISNDKKNIENNPKNIKVIAEIVSKINSITKPINEIYKGNEPFGTLEAPITKLGSVGHTLPSIIQHIKTGTKEQKVGAWKNIFICFLIDLLVPLAVYVLIKQKEGEDGNPYVFDTPRWKQILGLS